MIRNILLVVDADAEIHSLAAGFVDRYGNDEGLHVDIVATGASSDAAVTPEALPAAGNISFDLLRSRGTQEPDQTAYALADLLRGQFALHAVNVHRVGGAPATAIAELAQQLRSSLVVVEVRSQGLLARLNPAGFVNQLIRLVPCAVELIKPYATVPRSHFNVLVAVDVAHIADYPFEQLAAMPWPAGTRLHLLGLAARADADEPLETHPFRVLHSLSTQQALVSRAGALLSDAAERLRAALPATVSVDFSTTTAAGNDAMLGHAARQRASLIATWSPVQSAALGQALAGWLARSRDADLALRAGCSVLVLRDGPLSPDVGRAVAGEAAGAN